MLRQISRMSHNQDAYGLTLGPVLSTEEVQRGNDQLCLGRLANTSLGMSFVTWILKTEQDFIRQPGTLEGKGRMFWAKRQGNVSDNLASPKKDRQEYI